MSVDTYTKIGNKATTVAKLDKKIFEVEVRNHELLKQAYVAYLTNGRINLARTKTRGLVRGGGRKPWRQKGTGRARVGSSRTPLWRGGGIIFGPTGQENYKHYMSTQAKRQALRQALTLANQSGKIKVIETFECKEGKVAQTVKFLNKIGAERNTLLVISVKDNLAMRATRNIPRLTLVQARYLNVFDVLNTDNIVISQKALELVQALLSNSSQVTDKKDKQ